MVVCKRIISSLFRLHIHILRFFLLYVCAFQANLRRCDAWDAVFHSRLSSADQSPVRSPSRIDITLKACCEKGTGLVSFYVRRKRYVGSLPWQARVVRRNLKVIPKYCANLLGKQ